MKIRVKNLERKTDDRGWLAELIRKSDLDSKEFGQLSITTILPNKTKGKHYHVKKNEWYCVIKGEANLTIINNSTREEKEIYLNSKDLCLVEIPKNHYHAVKNIGNEEVFLLVYYSEEFNPTDPDTYYDFNPNTK